MDVGSMFMPLGTSNGTSNAVMFGVALMNFRDADLNFLADRPPAPMYNHDMDAPAWWNFDRKSHIYIEGFAEKGHKGLMQFMLVRQNGPQQFRAWEKDFRNVYAFLSELRPPKYPLAIDEAKASHGQRVFANHCAQCHGSYGSGKAAYDAAEFPNTMVSIDDIGTDRVRHDALTPRHRRYYGESWFADYGKIRVMKQMDISHRHLTEFGLRHPTFTMAVSQPCGTCFTRKSDLRFGVAVPSLWTRLELA
jgi:hypothetical protein